MTASHSIQSNSQLEQAFDSASQLRVFKTKLTRTAGVLEHLADPQTGLGQLLKPAEIDVLHQSIEVIQTFSQQVDRAKESKLKNEKALEQAFDARQSQSWELTKAYFSLDHYSLDQQVNGICMAMSLNQLGLLKSFKTFPIFKADLLKLAEGLAQNYGIEYFFHELFSDCQEAIQAHIAVPSTETVQCQLNQLQILVEAICVPLRESEQALLTTLTSYQRASLPNRGDN